VPADPVLAIIAEALLVTPDFFVEYRLRQVAEVLDHAPALADKLYAVLLRNQPVPPDLPEALASANDGETRQGGGGPAKLEFSF
jgi:hypothetical protein